MAKNMYAYNGFAYMAGMASSTILYMFEELTSREYICINCIDQCTDSTAKTSYEVKFPFDANDIMA
jgi:hypothetical protein